jgi:hypothetical protein
MIRASKAHLRRFAIAILALALIGLGNRGCTSTNPDNASNQLTFSTPEHAVKALVAAMAAHDSDKLEKIFGPGNEDLLSSGDDVADQQVQNRFLQAYNEKHQLISNDDGSVTVALGANDWPMPIPIVKDESGKAWVFDTEAGKDEIINRRIGHNELTVIEVCRAIGDAQREYAQRDVNGNGVREYARKFISDPGTHNGLYWPTAPGEDPSPLGELAAEAQGEGYAITPTTQPRPYHGYLYRVLTAQGRDAPGGPMNYVIKGQLIGGFAVVAWPAEYGNSGIMTFITNYSGDVYQKDLGEQTDKLAREMTEYNPDASWKKADQAPVAATN